MALSLLQQQCHDVDLLGRRPGQRNLVRFRSIGGWSADLQLTPSGYWHDVRHGAIAIQDGDGLATLHDTKKLAQSGLEFGDANLLHDQM
jgi:hypothetical protein